MVEILFFFFLRIEILFYIIRKEKKRRIRKILLSAFGTLAVHSHITNFEQKVKGAMILLTQFYKFNDNYDYLQDGTQ